MRFVDDFVNYAQEFTGCPVPFLEWSAILCLSVVAGRKHCLRRGDWNVYPNLWILLLGQSSSYKSTGLAIARRLLRDACPDVLLGQEYSSEKLLDDLQANPHRLFTYDEAETFFKMLTLKYNPTMKSALMTLWRDDWYVRKTKTGEAVIRDAYLCWGGASTPVQIAAQINGHDTDLLSGMLPRFTLVPYFGEEHSIPNPPPSDVAKKNKLVARLKELSIMGEREYAYHNGTLKMIEEWQIRFDKRTKEYDPILGAFLRKMRDEHFHKLAMISAFERGTTEMNETDIGFVIPKLWQIESQLSQALGHLTDTQFGRVQDRVSAFLKGRMIVNKSELYRRFSKIDSKTMNSILQNLDNQDCIEMTQVKGKTKPIVEIKWIQNIS